MLPQPCRLRSQHAFAAQTSKDWPLLNVICARLRSRKRPICLLGDWPPSCWKNMLRKPLQHLLAAHALARNPHPLNGHRARAKSAGAAPWSTLTLATLAALSAPSYVSAQQEAALQWSIPAQPLVSALHAFSDTGKQQLLFDQAQLASLQSQPLNGRHTPAQALQILLAGTGIAAVQSSEGFFTLKPQPAKAPQSGRALPEVTVQAAAATGLSENTDSYTVSSSSAATGLNLSLRETPQSVSVITRAQIEDQNLTNFNDVMDQAVGVTRWNSGDSETGYGGFYARGFQINNYLVDGVSTAPGSMGGFRGQSGLGSRDMAIFDNVTVVRGATGLLSGAGTPSASINLVRKRPTKAFQASVTGQAGRWNRYRGEADISSAINTDGSTRGRLVAVHEDNGSWVQGAHNDKTTLYGVLETELTPMTTLYGGIEYFRMRAKRSTMHGFEFADTAGQQTQLSGFDNPSTNASYDHLDRAILFANLEHNFNNGWQLKSEISHTRVDADKLYGVATGTVQAGTNASSVTYGKAINKPKQNSVDVRLTGPYTLFGREQEVLVGMSYYRLTRDDPSYARHYNVPLSSIYGFDGSTPHNPFVVGSRAKDDIRQAGLYASTHLQVNERLSFVLGGRVSAYKSTADDLKESAIFTPYVGVTYDLTKDWSVYSSYTTIFTPQSQEDVTGKTLKPQKGSNIELGLKGALFDGQLNASAAVFQTKADNLAVADGKNLTPSGNQAYIAMNDTTTKGYELELSGEVLPRWQVAGGFTRVITRANDRSLLNTGNVPEHQFKIFSSYRFSGALSGLTLGAGVNWQSKVYENSARYSAAHLALYQEKARTLVSLMARYQFTPAFDVALNLDNATDRRYRASNLTLHNIGAPRNLTATVKYRF